MFKYVFISLGYYCVVEIFEGVMKINIMEMYKSNNYLVLRSCFGCFIINGNWVID